VNDGVKQGADYIISEFKKMGLQPISGDTSYSQYYSFNVNTFPRRMGLQINNQNLIAGQDFLVDAASKSYFSVSRKIETVDLNTITTTQQWDKLKKKWKRDKNVLLLQNVDSFCSRLSVKLRTLPKTLPKRCYIIPQHGKLTWTVATTNMDATIFYVEDTVLAKAPATATVSVDAAYIKDYKNQNIIATIPGTIKDSFIVFSAHYDHLGMMGEGAMFPGGSDNASGTSTMLYLAHYFATHPQRYTMVFIAFSGEEAGLLGSDYYVKHPLFPLDHIRFLTNIDIMGDATKGVTIVNATVFNNEFELLQNINKKNNYLPEIKSRGKAANSDHYHFSEAGVPAFFMYSNSGKGYYHDVFDKANTLSLNNLDKVVKLLIDFTEALTKK
jgi:hypothetical protein